MPFWVNEDGATAVKAQKMDQLSGLGKKKTNRNHFTQEGILEFTWKNEQVCFVIKEIGRISILGRG